MKYKPLVVIVMLAITAACITIGCTSAQKVVKDEIRIQDAAFEIMMKDAQLAIQANTKAGFDEQKEILARIETTLAGLKPESESEETTPTPSEEISKTETVTPDPPEPEQPSKPVKYKVSGMQRLPGPHWDWEGKDNVSISTAEKHLAEHGIIVSGLTMEDMEILHDNAHNAGNKSQKTTVKSFSGNYYSTRPVRSSNRRNRTFRFFSSSCPGGRCPR